MKFRNVFIVITVTLSLYLVYKKFQASDFYFPATQLGPDVEYHLEKRGIPTEENLQFRFSQLNKIKLEQSLRAQNNSIGNWTLQGPANIGAMITCIAVDPTNESIIYLGFSEGGLWKTMDGGNSWDPIFDNEISLSIGCIAIDPKNPQIIYVGTGDPNNGSFITAGNGLYKSINGGRTWKTSGLQECRNIAKIIVDKQNPNSIYVAALGNPFTANEHRGFYKSTDGGLSWSKKLFIGDQVGCIDLIADPSNSKIMYTSTYDRYLNNATFAYGGKNAGVYKTVDGGENWTKLQGALPSGQWGRVNLAIATSNPNIVYLSYVKFDSTNKSNPYDLGGIRRSIDKGKTWTETDALNGTSGLDPDCMGGFAWYFSRIFVNPKDENDIYLLGIDLWRSFDAGEAWLRASPPWQTYQVHADKHDIAYLNDGSILLATDGGLFHSDPDNLIWQRKDSIPCTQFYRVSYFDQLEGVYFGGAQDNGSMAGNKDDVKAWTKFYGGDGFQVRARNDVPEYFFAETQNGGIWNVQTGENMAAGLSGRKNWDMPYFVSKYNDEKLIAGSEAVYENVGFTTQAWQAISDKLTDNGPYPNRRIPTISALDESGLDENIIIAGTTNGNVWKRKSIGDLTWQNITANLPAGSVTSLHCSPKNKNTFYVSLTTKQKNDYTPRVFVTEDAGISWKDIHNNLPQFPVYDIIPYPYKNDSVLFVANDIGVYASKDKGLHWDRVGESMPFIPVYDLEFNLNEDLLIAGTYARSIQTFDIKNIFKSNPVGIQEIKEEDITIFPNPATSFLFISKNLSIHDEITLYDLMGHELTCQIKDVGDKFRMDIGHINSGSYYLKIGSTVKSIVVY